MTESMERQRCFEFLLDAMDADDRLRFEAQLTFDDALALELRSCEAELAAFAEASAVSVRPPDSIWAKISEEVGDSSAASGSGFWSTIHWGKLAWPLAACLLLGLNFWQFLHFSSAPETSAADSGIAGSAEIAASGSVVADGAPEATMRQLREEIESLRSQVGEVRREFSEGSDDDERLRTVTQVRLLRERRDDLEKRIEFLESYYVALVDLSGATAGTVDGADEVEDELGIDLAYSQSLLMGGLEGGIWSKLESGLSNADLVTLSISDGIRPPTSDVPGLVSATAVTDRSAYLWQSFDSVENVNEGLGEPYAFAFIDRLSNQAILTLGELPQVSPEEQLVLWARGLEGEGYRQIAGLPSEYGGRSANVGVRLPEDFIDVAEFMVTLEPAAGDAAVVEQPSERVVLKTVPSP